MFSERQPIDPHCPTRELAFDVRDKKTVMIPIQMFFTYYTHTFFGVHIGVSQNYPNRSFFLKYFLGGSRKNPAPMDIEKDFLRNRRTNCSLENLLKGCLTDTLIGVAKLATKYIGLIILLISQIRLDTDFCTPFRLSTLSASDQHEFWRA